jgi:Molybdopterin oxidoreductase Fe4S4 domain
VYATGGQVIQIEGNPASPISRGRLCPKGSASVPTRNLAATWKATGVAAVALLAAAASVFVSRPGRGRP